MDTLTVEKTLQTPEIQFDARKGHICFLGRSLPNNAKTFYEPIFQWFKEYLSNPAPITKLTFEFSYMNSGTTWYVMEGLKKAETLKNSCFNVEVEWVCEENDEDMIETGEILQSLTNIPFQISIKTAC